MHEKFENNLLMEEKVKMIETLLERVTELGKTSLELYKLKTMEKTAAVISTVVPRAIAYTLFSIFLLFLNLGLALWLGEVIGNTYYGFFSVAAFYAVVAVIVHFFMNNWLKRVVNDLIIKLSFNKDSDE